jgi:hypothetical protein
VVSDYYVPWDLDPEKGGASRQPGSSSALRLAVRFDKNQAKIAEAVRCEVDAERVGFRGDGMLLAEIGLPPGSEVDRESLENAKSNSGWDLNEYDVEPDRLIVYLWPKAGGTKFSFSFKARFALKALSGPSIVYDYYNPEAHALVAPTAFTVQ